MRGQDETLNRDQLMWVFRNEDGSHPEWVAQLVTDAELRRMRDELLPILLTPRERERLDAEGFISWDGDLEALSDEALKAMFGKVVQTFTTPQSKHPTTYIELSTGERIEVSSGFRYALVPQKIDEEAT